MIDESTSITYSNLTKDTTVGLQSFSIKRQPSVIKRLFTSFYYKDLNFVRNSNNIIFSNFFVSEIRGNKNRLSEIHCWDLVSACN